MRGDPYLVNGDYMLLLKATNYEMTFWDKARKRYYVRWLQNKEKTFPVSVYGKSNNRSKSSVSQNSIKEMRKITYHHCKQYLSDVKLTVCIGQGNIVQIRARNYSRIRDAFKAFTIGMDYR